MSDPRLERAQQLLWEAEALRRHGVGRALRRTLGEMAALHHEVAVERLASGDTNGWIDLYAAVSAFGEAGEKARAREILDYGRTKASGMPAEARENIDRELTAHREWLDGLVVLPSLAELAPPVPVALPILAA